MMNSGAIIRRDANGDYTDITKQYTDDDPMPYEVNILRSEILSIDMNEIFVERDPSFNLITGSFKVRDNGYTFKSLDESVAIVSNDGVVTPADQTSAIALGTTYIVFLALHIMLSSTTYIKKIKLMISKNNAVSKFLNPCT